ncbi:NUDIX domain-containing protein [Streptomyces fuscigenes]|uniref:NUDIX domain-containing protein n=1 Tax=Streptomyces fuscigenes TaxID=1528880 RepID=UPI001F42F28C|nr:NUDIX domain-containing protein [Streptomyces fuscigenes]MCF3963639.1 NUDIX domain-containing protein [Streptomyces fuscigenes]
MTREGRAASVADASTRDDPQPPGPAARAHTDAAALLVNDAGEYLLHLRDHIPGIRDPGAWSLIGGSREGDETAGETIDREILEEVGLVVADLRLLCRVELPGPGGAAGGRIDVFHGRWNGDAHALPLTEGVMCHWFTRATSERLRLGPIAATALRRHGRSAGVS